MIPIIDIFDYYFDQNSFWWKDNIENYMSYYCQLEKSGISVDSFCLFIILLGFGDQTV